MNLKSDINIPQEYNDFKTKDNNGYFDNLKILEQMHILTLHWRKKATNRNPCNIIVVPNYYIGLKRNMIKRGINPYPLCARLMTEVEIKDFKNAKRVQFIGYYNWNDLIQEETEITNDREWITILNTLRKDQPFTKETTIGKHGQIKLLF